MARTRIACTHILTRYPFVIWTSVNIVRDVRAINRSRLPSSAVHWCINHVTYGIHHTWHELNGQSHGRFLSESTSLTQARLCVSSMFYITVSRMEWGPGGMTTPWSHLPTFAKKISISRENPQYLIQMGRYSVKIDNLTSHGLWTRTAYVLTRS